MSNLQQAASPAKVNVVMLDTERYEELLNSEQLLQALRAAGVDNWDGYDYAFEILREWNDEEFDDGL